MVRELKHMEIGDIPVDWKLQTFDETFRVISNNTLSRENLNNRGGAVRNIHYGDILTKFPEVLDCNEDEIPFINDLSLLSSSTQLLQDGDVVIADTAEDETVGKVTEVQNLGNGKLVAGLHTIPCRVKKGDFAPGWLGYYMNSNLFHNQVIPFITGIKVSSISKGAIAETLILIPPKEKQILIVEALKEIDRLIHCKKKIISKKKGIKKGVCQQLLTGKYKLDEFCDCAWTKSKIGALGQLIKNSFDPQQFQNELFWEYSMPAYDDGRKPYRMIGKSMSSMRFSISAPILLFNKLNVRQKRVWYVEQSEENSLCSTEFLPFISNKVDLYFLKELLLSDAITFDFENMSTGTSNSQKRISPESFLEYEVFIPEDKKEQEAIAMILKDINCEIESEENELRKIEKVKQGMISKFFES